VLLALQHLQHPLYLLLMSWSFQPEIEWNGMDNINYDTAEVMSPMLHVQSPWLFQAGTENWVKRQYRYHILLSGTWVFTSTIILQANIATFSNLLHSHRCLEDLLRLLILNHGRVGNHSGLPHHLRLELLLLLRHTSSHRLSCRQNGSHLKPLSHNADCNPRQSSTPTKSDSLVKKHTLVK